MQIRQHITTFSKLAIENGTRIISMTLLSYSSFVFKIDFKIWYNYFSSIINCQWNCRQFMCWNSMEVRIVILLKANATGLYDLYNVDRCHINLDLFCIIHEPAMSLDWPSAWQGQTSWVWMQTTSQLSSSTDATYKLLKSSHIHHIQLAPSRHWCQQQGCQCNCNHGKTEPVWCKASLTENIKMCVYKTCVFRTLLYGGENWTTYARHKKKLNSFHLS